MPATRLASRALVRLSPLEPAEDAAAFLQGLVTNDVKGALPVGRRCDRGARVQRRRQGRRGARAARQDQHAWIGVRDIFMDYIKPTGVRPRFTPRLEAHGFKLPPSIFGAQIPGKKSW